MKNDNQTIQTRTDKRRETLLNGGEISLQIEGRFTNLRIFRCYTAGGKKYGQPDGYGIRLDCYNQYSAPLDSKTIGYLDKENTACTKLNAAFGFRGANEGDLETILEIIQYLTDRDCLSW